MIRLALRRPIAGALPLSLAATLGSALVGGCGQSAPPPRPATPVTIAIATRATVPYTITANGVVEPLQTVAVQPQISGQLVEVAFREGDEVTKGQVLFRIDPRPFEAALRQAEATLARDRATATNSAREAERYQALIGKGYVTQSQAEQQRATAASQAAVVQADEAAAEAARLNLSYATIRAPISGRTGSLLLKAGNIVRVPSPQPLVVINQIMPVMVRFTVPAPTLPDLQKVMKAGAQPLVHVAPSTTDSAHVTMIPESGRLEFVDNAVDTTTGAITVKARFANTSRTLWPGQFLSVLVDVFEETNALTVPAIAVQTGQQGNYVYVVDSAQKARMQPVKVSRTAGETAVIASGLTTGARVVTDGQSRLFPGAAVVVRDGLGAPASGPGGGRRGKQGASYGAGKAVAEGQDGQAAKGGDAR